MILCNHTCFIKTIVQSRLKSKLGFFFKDFKVKQPCVKKKMACLQKSLNGSYYALFQSLDFVLGCTGTCSHAWWFENRILFYIIYIITIPLSPA